MRKSTNHSLHEQLEARILFDAVPDGSLENLQQLQEPLEQQPQEDQVAVNPAIDLTQQPERHERKEVVFVDKNVGGYEKLVAELAITNRADVFFINSADDGLLQIAEQLQNLNEIDAIHIISHGKQGKLFLGNTILDAESMQGEHRDELFIIGNALSDHADVLVYGCDFSGGEAGLAATTLLASITGADVAASIDNTGAAALGGDWDLETQIGSVQTDTLKANHWHALLALPVAVDDAITVIPGSTTNIDVLADNGSGADSDPDGDPLSITHIIDPTNPGVNIPLTVGTPITLVSGTQVTLLVDGTLDVVTPVGLSPTDTFDYIIDDGNGGTAQATVTLNIDTDADGVIDSNDIDDDNDGILDINEGQGVVVGGQIIDSDNDGVGDWLDIDKDNDGITDNVEAQTTAGYVAPSGTGAGFTDVDGDGLDDAYDADTSDISAAASLGLTEIDTDSDGIVDTLDADSDNDGTTDMVEAGHGQTIAAGDADTDGDGLKDSVDSQTGFDVNDDDRTATTFALADTDGDLNPNPTNADPLNIDLDFREFIDTDGDNVNDIDDIDDDNDGILDINEYQPTDLIPVGVIPNSGAWPGLTTSNYTFSVSGTGGTGVFPTPLMPVIDGKWPANISPYTGVFGDGTFVLEFDTPVRASEIILMPFGIDYANMQIVVEGEADPSDFELRPVTNFPHPSFNYDPNTGNITIPTLVANHAGALVGSSERLVSRITIIGTNPTRADSNVVFIGALAANDFDNDGIADHLDIDKDNDGITDNVEAQTTAGYIAPSGTGAGFTDVDGDGLDDAYDADTSDTSAAASLGLTEVDTDSDGIVDTLDADSDNDGIADMAERGDGAPTFLISTTDTDGDGLVDIFEGTDNADGFDVNDENLDGADTNFQLVGDRLLAADGSNAIPLVQDLLFRDNDTDGDGVSDLIDIDDDNDGILDVDEGYSESFHTFGLETQQWWWSGSNNSQFLIDFSSGTAQLVTTGEQAGTSAFEGTANYTDPFTGELLIYTDGNQIFNGQTHQLIATGLGGNSSSVEAALIIPLPGGDVTNDFLIFGSAANIQGVVNFAIVDVAAGTVTPPTALNGGTIYGEALGIAPHDNGKDYWLLTITSTEAGDEQLHAFLVNDTSVANTPVTTVLPGVTDANRSMIDYDMETGQLIIGAYGTTSGVIQLADFDATTGAASNVVTHATGQVGFSAALSPDGTKLYYTNGIQGFWGLVVQKDLTTGIVTNLGGGTGFGQIREAPDGKLYVAGINRTTLGVIENPNAAGTAATFDPTGFDLGTFRSGYALPNPTYANLFIQQSIDSDGDGIADHLDIDKDNDGITDNVEAQTTAGYIAPSGIGAGITDLDGDGLDDNYDANTADTSSAASLGLTEVDTDSDGIIDTLDADSDNDGILDIVERGDGQPISITSSTDTDGDGLLDIFEGASVTDGFDVNDENLDPTDTNFNLADTDNDTAADGSDANALLNDMDYRDAKSPQAFDDFARTPVGEPVTVPVLDNDIAPNSDPLSVVILNVGQGGTATVDANGNIVFTPDSGFFGTTTIEYLIEDSCGGTSTATVTIEVFLPYTWDSHHKFDEDFDASYENGIEFDQPLLTKQIFTLAPEPIFSGYARPGTQVVGRIYDQHGRLMGEGYAMSDPGGNWMMQFQGIAKFEHYRIEFDYVVQPADIYGYFGLAPSDNSYQAMQPLTGWDESMSIHGAIDNAPENTLTRMHHENNRPQGIGTYVGILSSTPED